MRVLKNLKSESGMAALLALILVGMLTLIGLAVMSTTDDEVTITSNHLQSTQAFYAAEAGLDMAAAELETMYDSLSAPPPVLPYGTVNDINNCVISYDTQKDGAAKIEKVTTGTLAGLNAFIQEYAITSTGTSNLDQGTVSMSQTFETVMVPIFQWAIFYNNEMWAQPIFDLTVEGRVHVNESMYLQNSGNGKSLSFLDKVTCGGDINYGLPSGTNSSGDVQFTDRNGNLVSMNQGGNWIDAGNSNWHDTASSLWQGNVQDKSFGQNQLRLPIANGGDPRKIIERSTGNPNSLQNKATFQIIDGVPYSKIGSVWQDVSSSLPSGTITSNGSTDFYDAHEKKDVQNTQVDISLLKSSGYFPSNGIVYVSDQRSKSSGELNGTTLVNGAELGAPLTFVCENPLYVQGDYNTINKQPAATISDAVTFLSNNWDPSLSTNKYSDRKASQTEVNLSIVTGDIAPDKSNYGGGLENLPRFLEDWNGKEFKVRGSMVQMWRSQEANGEWRYIQSKDAYYSAPTRNWGYDTDLEDMSKLPPGTPMVRVFLRTGWKQEEVVYTNQEGL